MYDGHSLLDQRKGLAGPQTRPIQGVKCSSKQGHDCQVRKGLLASTYFSFLEMSVEWDFQVWQKDPGIRPASDQVDSPKLRLP